MAPKSALEAVLGASGEFCGASWAQLGAERGPRANKAESQGERLCLSGGHGGTKNSLKIVLEAFH